MTPPLHPPRAPRPRSAAEVLLEEQLRQARIPFEREVRFAPPRRWRADFLVRHPEYVYPYLIEVEGGSYTGGHKRGKAYESDCDKSNAATLAHFRLLRFTPAHVNDGRALAVIKRALNLEDRAA